MSWLQGRFLCQAEFIGVFQGPFYRKREPRAVDGGEVLPGAEVPEGGCSCVTVVGGGGPVSASEEEAVVVVLVEGLFVLAVVFVVRGGTS